MSTISAGTSSGTALVSSGDTTGNLVLIANSTTKISTGTPGSATDLVSIASNGQQSSVVPGGTTLYPEYKCRAWVNFNGTGTVAIRASGNVTSITDNNTGDYTINFTTAMPDANFAAVCGGSLDDTNARFFGSLARTTTTCAIRSGGLASGAYAATDALNATVAIFR